MAVTLANEEYVSTRARKSRSNRAGTRSPRPRHSATRVFVPAAAGVALWMLGRREPALVLLATCALIAVATLASTRMADLYDHGHRRLATVASTAVIRSMAAATWLVAALPIWLLSLVARQTSSASPDGTASGWHVDGIDRRTSAAGRTGSINTAHATSRFVRVTARLATLVVVAIAVALVWNLLVPRADRGSPEIAVAAPTTAPTIQTKHALSDDTSWVTANGTAVDESVFADEPWGRELLEQWATPSVKDPVLGWTLANASTPYMNVTDGKRVSIVVEDPEVTIWLFGGSTVYGIGQRDAHTIASELIRIAGMNGVRLAVDNLGVSGWVNWQETLLFERKVRSGQSADLAVFFDGVNDAGLGWERLEFGQMDLTEPLFLTNSEEERAARKSDATQRGYAGPTGDVGIQWIDLVADQYRRGVQRARTVGENAQISVVHIWQPQLMTVPSDRPGVRITMDNNGLTEEVKQLQASLLEGAIELVGAGPLDMTGIFDDLDHPVYFDLAHTNELGARLTAEALWEELEPAIRAAR